jgi:tRNA(Arg) A34 adenosine deaminase TadA
MANHERFMAMAIAEAKLGAAAGEQPFGAVVARGDELICKARSLKVGTSDATAHSETLAIKAATQKLRQRTLPDCVFYATCEPCPMCLGAILNAGIKTHLWPHAHLQFELDGAKPRARESIPESNEAVHAGNNQGSGRRHRRGCARR